MATSDVNDIYYCIVENNKELRKDLYHNNIETTEHRKQQKIIIDNWHYKHNQQQ